MKNSSTSFYPFIKNRYSKLSEEDAEKVFGDRRQQIIESLKSSGRINLNSSSPNTNYHSNDPKEEEKRKKNALKIAKDPITIQNSKSMQSIQTKEQKDNSLSNSNKKKNKSTDCLTKKVNVRRRMATPVKRERTQSASSSSLESDISKIPGPKLKSKLEHSAKRLETSLGNFISPNESTLKKAENMRITLQNMLEKANTKLNLESQIKLVEIKNIKSEIDRSIEKISNVKDPNQRGNIVEQIKPKVNKEELAEIQILNQLTELDRKIENLNRHKMHSKSSSKKGLSTTKRKQMTKSATSPIKTMNQYRPQTEPKYSRNPSLSSKTDSSFCSEKKDDGYSINNRIKKTQIKRGKIELTDMSLQILINNKNIPKTPFIEISQSTKAAVKCYSLGELKKLNVTQ